MKYTERDNFKRESAVYQPRQEIIMGFLKNMLKSVLKEAVGEAIEKQFGNNSQPYSAPAPKTAAPVSNTAASAANKNNYEKNPATDENYFTQLITEANFPEYTIERSVSPSVFDSSAHPSCFPISYLFKKDGRNVLAVLIMKDNQYRAMIAVGTYQILDEQNIPYIRFFKGWQNEKDYVLNRIRENLK